jgi:hypothetical protein
LGQAAQHLCEHVNTVKLLFADIIDDLDAEPIYYVTFIKNQVVEVRLVGNHGNGAPTEIIPIISGHIWGFRARNHGKRAAIFNVASVSPEHGIRQEILPEKLFTRF